jgi:hypothetical protein
VSSTMPQPSRPEELRARYTKLRACCECLSARHSQLRGERSLLPGRFQMHPRCSECLTLRHS